MLNLGYNQIIDVSPLAGLTSLTELGIGGNPGIDVSLLAGLTNLSVLNLGYNQIVDVSPLAGLTNLTRLYLYGNQIIDVSPLSGLTGLTWLDLSGNQIVDVSPLLGNAGLGAGDWIGLDGNPLSAQACIDISILEALGVMVYHDPCGGGEGEGEGEGEFVFTETPRSGQYQQGDSLSMTVAFIGAVGIPEIQWTKNGVDIPGEISDTFSINALTVDDTGAYRVRVTDDAKAIHVSPPAIITVTEGNSLPLATPPTLFLFVSGIALAGALVLRRVKRGHVATVENR